MYTYTYANHMYTCPYVAVIKRPDILQIIIQYSAEILWLYSYRPFTNKMHTYISMPVYATQRSSIFATHTNCHQRPSLSDPYLFTCNIKERQWDKNLSKQRARRAKFYYVALTYQYTGFQPFIQLFLIQLNGPSFICRTSQARGSSVGLRVQLSVHSGSSSFLLPTLLRGFHVYFPRASIYCGLEHLHLMVLLRYETLRSPMRTYYSLFFFINYYLGTY